MNKLFCFLLLNLLLIHTFSKDFYNDLILSSSNSINDFAQALNNNEYSVGEYKAFCQQDKIEIISQLTYKKNKELLRRKKVFDLIYKVNINSDESGFSQKNLKLLKEFFLSNGGAYFAKKIIQETINAISKDYLEFNEKKEELCGGQYESLDLNEVISGNLSDEGLFQNEFIFFKIQEHENGAGAFAQPALISIHKNGFKKHFPISQEEVDPLAIISHEFGHTRYGDPLSGASLEGERNTVILYENPIRLQNGYSKRKSYYSYTEDQTIIIESGEVFSGKVR